MQPLAENQCASSGF